jgi:hypothetical protein
MVILERSPRISDFIFEINDGPSTFVSAGCVFSRSWVESFFAGVAQFRGTKRIVRNSRYRRKLTAEMEPQIT